MQAGLNFNPAWLFFSSAFKRRVLKGVGTLGFGGGGADFFFNGPSLAGGGKIRLAFIDLYDSAGLRLVLKMDAGFFALPTEVAWVLGTSDQTRR